MSGTEAWWDRERHADRRPLLLARNRIQASLRDWFTAEGFTEVDPAALQLSPGNEAHLHAFATAAVDDAGLARRMFLHTSPEFAMKKLLAAGETRIFAFSHVWRNRERGPLHAPEFTMLEWYRAGEDYGRLMEDCREVLARAAEAAGAEALRFRGLSCDPYAAPERLSVAEAVRRHAGVDLMATLGDADRLAQAMEAAGLSAPEDEGWSDLFSRLLVARVEPRLGEGRATVLDRYPASEAALARRCPDDPRVSERFELYACGVELANAFGELTDPAEQRRRFERDLALRRARGLPEPPVDERLLAALGAGLPDCAGVALGFDRLVMVAAGEEALEEVVAFPAGRA